MAEETKDPVTEEAAPEEAAPPPVVKVYLLESAVRSVHNRTKRASVAGRQPFVQRLAGGRIIVRRARPARISEAVLLAHFAEIKTAVARHQIFVTTTDGKLVDLDTLQPGALVEAASSPPPNPPLDSAKNDKNEGVGYNVPGAPEGTTLDADEPAILREPLTPDFTQEVAEETDEAEGDEQDEEEPVTTPAETSLTPVTKPSASHQGRKHGKGKRG